MGLFLLFCFAVFSVAVFALRTIVLSVRFVRRWHLRRRAKKLHEREINYG